MLFNSDDPHYIGVGDFPEKSRHRDAMITVAMSITKNQFELLTSSILEDKVLRDLANNIAVGAKQMMASMEIQYGLRQVGQKDKSGYGIVGFGERYTKLYKSMLTSLGSKRAVEACIQKRIGHAAEFVRTGLYQHFDKKKRKRNL